MRSTRICQEIMQFRQSGASNKTNDRNKIILSFHTKRHDRGRTNWFPLGIQVVDLFIRSRSGVKNSLSFVIRVVTENS